MHYKKTSKITAFIKISATVIIIQHFEFNT